MKTQTKLRKKSFTIVERKHSHNRYVKRTLSALLRCRTSSLGGHVDKCDQCGHIRISYNSCRNRYGSHIAYLGAKKHETRFFTKPLLSAALLFVRSTTV